MTAMFEELQGEGGGSAGQCGQIIAGQEQNSKRSKPKK